MFWFFWVFLCFFLFPGCKPEGKSAFVPGQQRFGIFHGSAYTSDLHKAVVALTEGAGTGYGCSGTLITDRVVLTAAHCFQVLSQSQLQVFFGQDVSQAGEYRAASEVATHPDFYDNGLADDIALIRLSAAAPAGVTPIAYLPAAQGLTDADVSSSADFSGFGLTETGSDGVKLHLAMPLQGVCPGPSRCTIVGFPEILEPRTFGYSQGTGGPCTGDSGGPAFVFRGAKEYVAGITAYGDDACLTYGVSTQVDRFEGFIQNFLVGVKETLCTNGLDDDGDGQSDCADFDCASTLACEGPNACALAPTLTCGQVITASTSGGSKGFKGYSCVANNREPGPEKAFLLQIAQGMRVSALLTQTGAGDTDLFLVQSASGQCDPATCVKSSTNAGNTMDRFSFVMGSTPLALVVDSYNIPGDFKLEVTCLPPGEDCQNLVDDDGDSLVDCADPDCEQDAVCQSFPPMEVDCENGEDDDGDSLVDCADPDCEQTTPCLSRTEDCSNKIDDDGDDLIDCADPDCKGKAPCKSASGGGCASVPSEVPPFSWLGLTLCAWVYLRVRREHRAGG